MVSWTAQPFNIVHCITYEVCQLQGPHGLIGPQPHAIVNVLR